MPIPLIIKQKTEKVKFADSFLSCFFGLYPVLTLSVFPNPVIFKHKIWKQKPVTQNACFFL